MLSWTGRLMVWMLAAVAGLVAFLGASALVLWAALGRSIHGAAPSIWLSLLPVGVGLATWWLVDRLLRRWADD